MHPGDGDNRGTPDEVCQLNEQAEDGRQQAATPARRPRAAARATVRPAQSDPTTEQALPGDGEIAGREVEPIRAGDDTRRRGWFWHWNNIVTQFAPLIGLKGVGLLNSYTVWTDRRDESPHRGYAFPSQQSEASFYGEDRAELIALNKILVALDLIEIRKEMVTRVDAQGRRWRVPHNLYRVKDHGDGFNLSSRDVRRVLEIAESDRSVYRTIRHIFSDRFAPIDGQNVWWPILKEIAGDETWQRLAARAGADERRASARTKAGHAARKERFLLPSAGDTATPGDSGSDSATVEASKGNETSVAKSNNGSDKAVAPGNSGSSSDDVRTVDPSNRGRRTTVAPANTIKDQDPLTTTTTTGPEIIENAGEEEMPLRDDARSVIESTAPKPAPAKRVATADGTGPGGQRAPADVPAENGAVRAFEDANGRPSTPAERHLLRGIAAQTETAAREQGGLDASGWAWLTAAIYEAVEAGSSFVAPRRLREIIARWTRDGAPDALRAAIPAMPESARSGRASTPSMETILGDGGDFPLPHGFGSRQTWAFAVTRAAESLDRAAADDLFRGSALIRYHDGEATIAVTSGRQADQLSGGYRGLVERALGEAMRRPVRIAIIGPDEAGASDPPATPRGADAKHSTIVESTQRPEAPAVFEIAGSGMTNEQVWAAVLDELMASGDIPVANLAAWVRPAKLVGQGSDGRLIVGAPHAPALRRIANHFVLPIESALGRVLGAETRIEVVVLDRWLAAREHGTPSKNMPAGEEAGG